MYLRRYFIIALFFLALPAVLDAQFIFTTNNGVITITGYNGPGGTVVIPDATNGYPVTGIGAFAFENCTNQTSIIIPGSITNIGLGAFFGCASLTNISVNAGNTRFTAANGVLYDLTQGTLIDYPEGLATTNGIYETPLSVTNISPYAFASCTSLTNIFLDADTIGKFAFFQCTSLANLTVTRGLDSGAGGGINIQAAAFAGCVHLVNLDMANTVANIGDMAFSNCCSLGGVIIPGLITNIGQSAFAYCSSLAYVAVPDGITNIGNFVFAYCTNLTAAYFEGNAPPNNGTYFYADPNAVAYYSLGTSGWGPTFSGVPTMWETPASEFTYQMVNHFDYDTITITKYNFGYSNVVVIPGVIDGYLVTSIGVNPGGAFQLYPVTSVTVPNTVTNLGNQMFAQCASLTNVTIPNSVKIIGNQAFFGCTSLANIVIPHSVIIIGNSAFQNCGRLDGVTIPNGATTIGSFAFQNCTNLTSIVVPGSVTNFGLGAFESCRNLASVTIAMGVTSIASRAFFSCTNLASIAIPASVIGIGQSAFQGCTSLANISVDAANPSYSILDGVLFDKPHNTLIDYPPKLAGTFYHLPNSVTSVGFSALGYCSGLTGIVVPASVISIQGDAFQHCGGLTSIWFEGNAPPDLGNTFLGDSNIVYYLPGTTGWGTTFGGAPTALWYQPQPTFLSFEPSFGVQNQQFGFTISWATNASVIVQVSTNLTNPNWIPLATNSLNNGTNYFADPLWTNYPSRFYRISTP